MTPTTTKPNLLFTLLLKCPHCGKTPLRKKGQLVNFQEGCTTCHYKFEREVGYFSGASWMMNYTFAALTAMVVGGYMIWKHGDASDMIIAGVPAAVGAISSVVFIPWGRSLWMWLDHTFHPLNADDFWNPS